MCVCVCVCVCVKPNILYIDWHYIQSILIFTEHKKISLYFKKEIFDMYHKFKVLMIV